MKMTFPTIWNIGTHRGQAAVETVTINGAAELNAAIRRYCEKHGLERSHVWTECRKTITA
jgi:hypothetical protein